MTAQLPKLFMVTENFEGRRCYWFVLQRKHALVGVADTMQEFFTKAEARTFVKFARNSLDIPDLRIAPAPATPPSKSFEDRMVERGEELHMVLVSEDENFGVTCFDEQWPPGKSSDITPEQFRRAFQKLIDAGDLVPTGEYRPDRNGMMQPVYAAKDEDD
jgi:hypothetical protein